MIPRANLTTMDIAIGIKLDIGFATELSYRQLFGTRNIPEYLAELGLETVETPVGLGTNSEVLAEHVAHCRDAGLNISLHPYSERTDANPAFFSPAADNACRSFHQRFLSLAAEISSQQQAPIIVNIHAAAGTTDDSRRDLIDQSVAFFSWAHQWCRRNAPLVHPVAELQISPNPDESIQRIGDTYDELLEIVTRSQVQACWDFGHAFMNQQRYGGQLFPPEEFLQRVGHVHCHDVCGDDHHPLVYETVPWKKFIRLLIESGYDKGIILEVFPENFLAAGGIQSLLRSLEALNTQIRQRKLST
ncbi:MAG: sugar phosphate isomerase/epimerase [Phycisphaerales bacterium]|nr:MAG: sugar phosphate isomerase/epimerase [Phycisphaerales bacterium]